MIFIVAVWIRYFLHYSGHGGQVADLDGDETDGMDNCIFPLDHQQNGVIIDDVRSQRLGYPFLYFFWMFY